MVRDKYNSGPPPSNQNGYIAGDMPSYTVLHGGVEERVDRTKLRRPNHMEQAVDQNPHMTRAPQI